MYHPMLTFAIAQTRLDDLNRDLAYRARRSSARSTDTTPQRRAGFARFARFSGARRTRAAAV